VNPLSTSTRPLHFGQWSLSVLTNRGSGRTSSLAKCNDLHAAFAIVNIVVRPLRRAAAQTLAVDLVISTAARQLQH